MVRVLHVINGAALGGISSMILNYYRYMDREQVHFDFVTSIAELGYNGKELEKLGCKFYFIEMKSKGLWNHIKQLNTLMKKEHFDAIHVHSNHTSYVALMVAWKNGIPVRVAHGHNAVKDKLSLKARVSRRVGIILIKGFSTKRLACSKDAAVYTFGRHSLKEHSLQILPNAIDVEKFRFRAEMRERYRTEFNIQKHATIIGCVGRMSSEKNHIFLVEQMPSLLKKLPKAKIMLIGDGAEKRKLEQRAEELGVAEHIIFAGERNDVSNLLNVMDVFVLPSTSEGLGIAAVEAAASGLPVVLSDHVPKELKFIPNSTYVSLDDQSKWIDEIEAYAKQYQRNIPQSALKTLRDHGYDIRLTCKKLETEYLGGGGVNKDTFILGTVGRMSQEKNQRFLLYLFARILDRNANSMLVLVGDGEERQSLQELALKLGIADQVLFTGNRTDISGILNALDVFILPSQYEGFPIAAVEALSNGLPVLLSDRITRELSFSSNAVYISLEKSYEEWAELICSRLENSRLEGQEQVVRKHGYDISYSVQQLMKCYLKKK